MEEWKSKYAEIMNQIELIEGTSDVSIIPDDAMSHDPDTRVNAATPVPLSAPPSFDLFSSKAAPVSPTQVVGSLLDIEGKDSEVLLPYKMISRPAATRIYHLDECSAMKFLTITA